MDDDALPTASMLPIGPTAPDSKPETTEDDDDWDVVHVGTADTPDHGAQAVMRTSDGDFRISAAEVDGKVGLKIEKLHPHETADGVDETEGEEETDSDEQESDDATGSAAPPEPAPTPAPTSA